MANRERLDDVVEAAIFILGLTQDVQVTADAETEEHLWRAIAANARAIERRAAREYREQADKRLSIR